MVSTPRYQSTELSTDTLEDFQARTNLGKLRWSLLTRSGRLVASKEVAVLIEKGFKVASSGKFADGGGFTYLVTDFVSGVMFELIQLPSH